MGHVDVRNLELNIVSNFVGSVNPQHRCNTKKSAVCAKELLGVNQYSEIALLVSICMKQFVEIHTFQNPKKDHRTNVPLSSCTIFPLRFPGYIPHSPERTDTRNRQKHLTRFIQVSAREFIHCLQASRDPTSSYYSTLLDFCLAADLDRHDYYKPLQKHGGPHGSPQDAQSQPQSAG
jgi:hypothetical protein